MSKDFLVSIINPERRALWLEMIGRDSINVLSPLPDPGVKPDGFPALFFKVDMQCLEEKDIARIVRVMSRTFGISNEEILRNIQEQGIPILADDCHITVFNPQRWLTD